MAGSTPLLLTSLRSSPPTPAPSTRRPGASWLIEASWRAVSSGCRSASRYTPTSTGSRSLPDSAAVAAVSPSKPVPS